MAETSVLPRLVGLAVAVVGYILVIVAHRRHGMKWIFSGYTAMIAAILLVAARNAADLRLLILLPPLLLVVSGILFFLSAHKSGQKIRELAEKVEKERITLGEGDTQ